MLSGLAAPGSAGYRAVRTTSLRCALRALDLCIWRTKVCIHLVERVYDITLAVRQDGPRAVCETSYGLHRGAGRFRSYVFGWNPVAGPTPC